MPNTRQTTGGKTLPRLSNGTPSSTIQKLRASPDNIATLPATKVGKTVVKEGEAQSVLGLAISKGADQHSNGIKNVAPSTVNNITHNSNTLTKLGDSTIKNLVTNTALNSEKSIQKLINNTMQTITNLSSNAGNSSSSNQTTNITNIAKDIAQQSKETKFPNSEIRTNTLPATNYKADVKKSTYEAFRH